MSALLDLAANQGEGLYKEVTSMATYFTKKCLDLLDDNANMIKQLWSHPEQLVTGGVSGALVDAVAGGMEGLAAFAENYIKNNAEALVLAALEATGAMDKLESAVQFVQNAIASLILANNNLIFQMLKEVAHEGMTRIAEKDQILIGLAELIKQLYVALASLAGTSSEWDAYHAELRKALSLVVSARSDLSLVQNTLEANPGTWLARKFNDSLKKLEQAKVIMTPQEANPAIKMIDKGLLDINRNLGTPNPDKSKSAAAKMEERKSRVQQMSGISNNLQQITGKGFRAFSIAGINKTVGSGNPINKGLYLFGTGLAENFPFPTTAQQRQAQLAVARLSSLIMKKLQGYLRLTGEVDGYVLAYITAMTALSESLPGFLKNYVLSLLKRNYSRVDTLAKHMAKTLNGAEDAYSGPIMVTKPRYPGDTHPEYPGDPIGDVPIPFRPNSLNLTTQNYKWIMDLGVIFQAYQLIPIQALNNLQLSADGVEAYRRSVAQLKSMNDLKAGGAILRMKEGQEQPADLESQIIALLLEANNAIISSTVRRSVLPLCRSVLTRLELSLAADHIIYNIFENFYLTPLPLQDTLNRAYDAMASLIESSGCEFLIDALKRGNFKDFLDTKGKGAMYVGRAMMALALLQKCNPGKFSLKWFKLNQMFLELKGQADLLNINFSINFNLAIFKNIQECLRLEGFAKEFNIEELICGIINAASKDLSSLGSKMKDVFSIGNETSAPGGAPSMGGGVL